MLFFRVSPPNHGEEYDGVDEGVAHGEPVAGEEDRETPGMSGWSSLAFSALRGLLPTSFSSGCWWWLRVPIDDILGFIYDNA